MERSGKMLLPVGLADGDIFFNSEEGVGIITLRTLRFHIAQEEFFAHDPNCGGLESQGEDADAPP